MKVTEAKKITDSLTRTSKMPGLSYSLPAWECKTGSKLRKVKNSVCSACYALKGNYTRYKNIKISTIPETGGNQAGRMDPRNGSSNFKYRSISAGMMQEMYKI